MGSFYDFNRSRWAEGLKTGTGSSMQSAVIDRCTAFGVAEGLKEKMRALINATSVSIRSWSWLQIQCALPHDNSELSLVKLSCSFMPRTTRQAQRRKQVARFRLVDFAGGAGRSMPVEQFS
jgi:hypothetical protein